MATYNPSIPQPTNLISSSQAPILGNFGQLNTQFGVDHTPFNNGGINGDGFHKQITFPTALAAAPTGVIGIIHDVIASAGTVSFAGKPIPYFANSVGDFPIMPDVHKGAGSDWSFQIGKVIVNCGFASTGGLPTNNKTIVFNQPYPVGATIMFLGVQAFGAPTAASAAMNVSGQNILQFTANSQIPNLSFYYLAIGA